MRNIILLFYHRRYWILFFERESSPAKAHTIIISVPIQGYDIREVMEELDFLI
jgi:hypothetical protein